MEDQPEGPAGSEPDTDRQDTDDRETHAGWTPPDSGRTSPGPGAGRGELAASRPGPTGAAAFEKSKGGDPRTGPLPLHPMSLGDILDGAFKLLRADAGTIVLITLALFGPLQLIAAWAQRDALDIFGILLNPDAAPTVAQEGFTNPAVSVLAGLARFLVLPFVTGAVTRVVGGSYLGETVSAGTALKAGLARWWSLLSAWVLVHLVEFVGVIVGFALLLFATVAAGGGGGGIGLVVLAGILMVLGLLGALFIMPLFVAVVPAIVMEDIGAVTAMRRSSRLMRRRYWPYLGTALLTGLLATIVTYALTAVPAVLTVVIGSEAWLLLAVGSVVANVVALPFVAIVATLMYFDGRIRTEAFDLTVVADDLARGRHA